MLKSKTLHRPDKQLETMLIGLVFAIIATALSILMLFIFPEHSMLFLSIILSLTVISICFAIALIGESEKALTYGGFANVILEQKDKICRIDNATFDAVIENKLSQSFFGTHRVMPFLQKAVFDDKQNLLNLDRLSHAIDNLKEESVLLELNIHDHLRWYMVYLRPLYLKKNDIFESDFSIEKVKKETYFLWQIEDVTAAQNIEQIMAQERQKLSRFIKDMPLGLYVLNHEGVFEYVNDTFCHSLKAKKEELIGQKLCDFAQDKDIKLFDKNCIKCQDLYFLKDTENTLVQLFIAQDRYMEKNELKTRGITLTDVPADKDILEKFNQITMQSKLLFEQSPIGIISVLSDGKIEDFNFRAQEIFASPLQGISISNILDIKDVKRLEDVRKSFLKNTETANKIMLETVLSTGKNITITASAHYRFENRKSQPDGLWLFVADTTESKNLEQQFAQAQKMQAMGQFAGGIAHDFNNLLTAMIGFCDLLLQRHRIGDPSFADLNEIKQNAVRAAGLVRQLLAFSRRQPSNPKLLDVADSFADLSQFLKRILGEQITLEFHHEGNLGFIRMDPVQFTQVILNLAVNAKDAMNGKGKLKISTRTERLIEPYTFGTETIDAGDFVVISVTDTGCGIKKENLTRIFDPFFSTKQNVVGSGTGLGLATVYGIVTQTKGFLKVESKENVGTTFKIYLPRYENSGQQEVQKSDDKAPVIPVLNAVSKEAPKLIFGLNVSKLDQNGKSTREPSDIRILFVEDEDSVRAFGVRALKKKGFCVTSCASAESALEEEGVFDLLITDMVMPGMTGAELAKKKKEKMPSVKIILASGYSEEIAKKELAASSDFSFIAKPYSLGDLTKKVFDVLNEQANNG